MTRRSGSTTSRNTGPSSGPSTTKPYYYYAEVSSPRQPGDVFELRYDGTDCPNGVASVSFKYHMYGNGMGTLEVVSIGSAAPTTSWTKSGNKGNTWLSAS